MSSVNKKARREFDNRKKTMYIIDTEHYYVGSVSEMYKKALSTGNKAIIVICGSEYDSNRKVIDSCEIAKEDIACFDGSNVAVNTEWFYELCYSTLIGMSLNKYNVILVSEENRIKSRLKAMFDTSVFEVMGIEAFIKRHG